MSQSHHLTHRKDQSDLRSAAQGPAAASSSKSTNTHGSIPSEQAAYIGAGSNATALNQKYNTTNSMAAAAAATPTQPTQGYLEPSKEKITSAEVYADGSRLPAGQTTLLQSSTFPLAAHDTSGLGKGRRLIVGCDGTWLNADADPTIPSNVARLCRALSNPSATVDQIVYYHRGVGTNGDAEDHYLSGATGSDLSEHVRECYSFLCSNFREGDEVYIFGFSRGAYTARAISSLISDVGLLTMRGMEYFYEIFEDWKDQNITPKENLKADGQPVDRGAFDGCKLRPIMPSDRYRAELMSRGLSHHPIPIRILGIFDTVGALGIPPVFGLHLSAHEVLQYSFVNTKVAQCVQHCFQALSLDDHRASYTPAVFQLPDRPHSLQTLSQVWFPGVHSNIGGSFYVDESLALETLAWLIGKICETETQPMLDFSVGYLKWVFDLNIRTCGRLAFMQDGQKGNIMNVTDKQPGFRGWGMGRMIDSQGGLFEVTALKRKPIKEIFQAGLKGGFPGLEAGIKEWWDIGDVNRTPGRYMEVDAQKGEMKATGKPLLGTKEKIHATARVRIANGGRGLKDGIGYWPAGLGGFEVRKNGKTAIVDQTPGTGKEKAEKAGAGPASAVITDSTLVDPLAKEISWVGKGLGLNGADVVLMEEEVGKFEKVLLGMCNDALRQK